MIRLLSLFAVILLAACTGSTERPSPVLLVVGFDSSPNAPGAQVGLVQDDLSQNQNRLTFLTNGVRPLTFPAVDYDVVDREGGRSALVVLSRSGERTPTGSAGTLTTFRLTGIDPDNPANFSQQNVLELNAGAFTQVPTTLEPNPVFCPKRVQVTQSGDYAAVLNDPGLCGLQRPPFIDILDLRNSRLLQRLSGGGGVSSSGLYLAQGASEDLLYYATREAGSLQLQRAALPRPGQTFGPDDQITVTRVADARVRIAAGQNEALDLQRSGSNVEERLVFLFRDSLASVTNFSGEAEVSDFIDTASNNAFVVRDDERELEGTFVLSTPESNTLTFIPPPDDLDTVSLEATAARAVDAASEPNQDNIYFVGVEDAQPQVAFVPLTSFDLGDDLPDLRPTAIPELTNPSFITFTQAVPQAAP